jgi:hypothetical protein
LLVVPAKSPKPLTRAEQWSADQAKARADSDARSAQASKRAAAAWEEAQRDAMRQGFEAYRADEFDRKGKR